MQRVHRWAASERDRHEWRLPCPMNVDMAREQPVIAAGRGAFVPDDYVTRVALYCDVQTGGPGCKALSLNHYLSAGLYCEAPASCV